MQPRRSGVNFAAEITASGTTPGRLAHKRRSCKQRHEIKRPALHRCAYTRSRCVRVESYSRSRLQHARAHESKPGNVHTSACVHRRVCVRARITRAIPRERRGIPIVHITYLCSRAVRIYRLSSEPVYTIGPLASGAVRTYRAIGHRWHSITYNARIYTTYECARVSARVFPSQERCPCVF